MSTIVGFYAGVESDYRRNQIAASFRDHSKPPSPAERPHAGARRPSPPRPSTGSARERRSRLGAP